MKENIRVVDLLELLAIALFIGTAYYLIVW
jgi:hypothetical protein